MKTQRLCILTITALLCAESLQSLFAAGDYAGRDLRVRDFVDLKRAQ